MTYLQNMLQSGNVDKIAVMTSGTSFILFLRRLVFEKHGENLTYTYLLL